MKAKKEQLAASIEKAIEALKEVKANLQDLNENEEIETKASRINRTPRKYETR